MRKPFAIAVLALLGSNAFAAGEVYRWKDSTGVWNYSDQPHAGAEVVRGQSAPSATPAPAPAASQAPAPTTNEPLPVSKEVAQEVLQDAATAKAKRCEKAKVDYDQIMQALRVRRADAKGNVTFLTAAEIDTARLEARAVKDLACGT